LALRSDDRLFMWAGGKNRLIPHYEAIFPEDVRVRPYVEPFAGGAAIFNHIVQPEGRGSILSDVNQEIVDLYRLVKSNPDFLINRMAEHEAEWLPLSGAGRKALYYRLREEYWSMKEGHEATALLYFLMKTGFNGIWQTCKASKGRYGTPVGLANQREGVFRPDVVRSWSRKLANTDLRCCSYSEIEIPMGAFVFCDPPYRESFTKYGTNFGDDDQIKLIEWCREVSERTGSVVWLCNREAGDGFFERHAGDAEIHRFPITYTAGRRKATHDGYKAKSATEILMVWSP